MTNREIAITRFVRSRGCALLLTLVAITFAVISDISLSATPDFTDLGLAFPSSNTWLPSSSLSAVIAFLFNLAIAITMVIINRSFNMLRTVSLSYAGLFLLMQASAPGLTGHLCDGFFLAAGILASVTLMFASYMQREATPRVFLAFFILGVGALWRLPWLAFIPAFIAGLVQMRIFSFRMLLAAGIGVITPLWIVWGAGITDPLQWHIPHFTYDLTLLSQDPQLQYAVITGMVSLATGTLLGIANIFKILSYNAATRAYNGLLYTISVTTGILAVVDWQHMSLYITLLNVCVAFQAAHFLKINSNRRGYLPVLIIIAIYCALFFSTMFIPRIWA